MNLGKPFPNFEADSTVGHLNFHEWLGTSWGILFSHPADFTPVCTTELATILKLHDTFLEKNVKVVALSCDSVEDHKMWLNDIKAVAKIGDCIEFPYPIIADKDREIAVRLNMIDHDEKDAAGIPLTARAVFVIDASKKLRLSILYPATIGRNFEEILRVIEALQLTDKYQVATPANWKSGDDVMIQPSVSDEKAKNLFPSFSVEAVPSGKHYIRRTKL